jgi:hypothetical protein
LRRCARRRSELLFERIGQANGSASESNLRVMSAALKPSRAPLRLDIAPPRLRAAYDAHRRD